MPGDFLGLLAQNIFAAYFLDTPIRKLIFGCNVMLFLCTFFDMAIYSGFYNNFGVGAGVFYVLGDRAISYFCGWLGWMPLATLAAQICPSSIEATLFGLIMSMYNIGVSSSSAWSGPLLDYTGVSQVAFGGMVDCQWVMVACRAVLPFMVLIFVPKGDPSEMTAEFERQNKHLIGEKVSGLVTADSLPQSANGAAEPDRPPPGSDEAVAL